MTDSRPLNSYEKIVVFVLMFVSSLTVMAGAIVSPSLPQIGDYFSQVPHASLLARLILTVPALFIALLAPFAGLMIDRFGRRKILLGGLVLYGFAGTSGLYLDNIYLLLTGRAFLGVAVACLMTASITLLADYFQDVQREQVMGIQGAAMSLGGVIYVGVGGGLADWGWRMPFGLYIVAWGLIPLCWVYLKEPSVEKENRIFETVSQLPWLRIGSVYGLAFIAMGVFYMTPVQIPFLLRELVGSSGAEVGLAIACATLAGSTTALGYGYFRRRMTFEAIYGLTFLLMGLGYLSVSYASSYWGVIRGLVFSGLGMGFLMPNTSLWLVSLAPVMVRGRVIGGLNTFLFMGQFLSPIMVFPLVQKMTIYGTFKGVGMGTFVLGILLLVFEWGFHFKPTI